MAGTERTNNEGGKLTFKDFKSPNTVRWCPGCGDYAILNALLKAFPEMGVPKEKFVVLSGIGCASRFPYYTQTYGFHTIHGRAPTVSLGVKMAQPDSSVWMITGDGDSLSIGGNHFMHLCRRNPDINVVIFNNKIYGLTKGQASPTSDTGIKTKSTPYGSIDRPVNAASLALTSGASFVARVPDTDLKLMQETFVKAQNHKGVSIVEVFVNCVIFNNKVFEPVTNRSLRAENTVLLEPGEPIVYGTDKDKGIVLDGLIPKKVSLKDEGVNKEDLLVHNPKDPRLSYLLSDLSYPDYPMPYGVLYQEERPTYETTAQAQASDLTDKLGEGDLSKLLKSGDLWTVDESGKTSTL